MTRKITGSFISIFLLCFVWGGHEANAKDALTCGDILSAAQLEKALGAKVEFDAKRKPVCHIKAKKGFSNGSIQVFPGSAEKKYGQMLSGAKKSLADSGKFSEPDSTGKKSFEFVGKKYGMDLVEVGFLDTSGRFAVLITLGAGWAKIESARKLAAKADVNLKKI